MKYIHYMQNETSDCGITIVKSLLKYFNKFNKENFEDEISNLNINQGLSLYDIENLLAKYGIEGSSYQVDKFDDILYEKPLIMVIDKEGQNHYVLVYEKIKQQLVVSDPEMTGIEYLNISSVRQNFKGYVFIIEDVITKEIVDDTEKK